MKYILVSVASVMITLAVVFTYADVFYRVYWNTFVYTQGAQ